jgi:hypothetical protein
MIEPLSDTITPLSTAIFNNLLLLCLYLMAKRTSLHTPILSSYVSFFDGMLFFVEAIGLSSKEILTSYVMMYLPAPSHLINIFNPNSTSVISVYAVINRLGSWCISNFLELYGLDLLNI